ncbi:hypothetical protein C8R44DRAFT_728252 [Mycena epipterygia]|nr:hypothetical protein C8R44DRAFT_728252 [Mycena epipterygia]
MGATYRLAARGGRTALEHHTAQAPGSAAVSRCLAGKQEAPLVDGKRRDNCWKREGVGRYYDGSTENRMDGVLEELLKAGVKFWFGGSGRMDITWPVGNFQAGELQDPVFDCVRDRMVLPEPPKLCHFVKRMGRGDCRDQRGKHNCAAIPQ